MLVFFQAERCIVCGKDRIGNRELYNFDLRLKKLEKRGETK